MGSFPLLGCQLMTELSGRGKKFILLKGHFVVGSKQEEFPSSHKERFLLLHGLQVTCTEKHLSLIEPTIISLYLFHMVLMFYTQCFNNRCKCKIDQSIIYLILFTKLNEISYWWIFWQVHCWVVLQLYFNLNTRCNMKTFHLYCILISHLKASLIFKMVWINKIFFS